MPGQGQACARKVIPDPGRNVEGGSEDGGFEGHGSNGTKRKTGHRPGLKNGWGLLADRSLGLVGGFLGGIGGGSNSLLARFPAPAASLAAATASLAASLVASTASLPASLVASTASLPASLPAASLAASAACLAASSAFWAASLAASTTGAGAGAGAALPSWNRRRAIRAARAGNGYSSEDLQSGFQKGEAWGNSVRLHMTRETAAENKRMTRRERKRPRKTLPGFWARLT
jgi:hypothetical protein